MSALDRAAARDDNLLGSLTEQVGHIPPTTPQERHSAALTVAEQALAGGWERGDVRDVLAALGLEGA